MITFKENTFVKGTYDELIEMAKAIEEKGGKIEWDLLSKDSNHLWFGTLQKSWEFDNNLQRKCDHELTKSQLYEAYGVVDTQTETEKFLEKDEHGFYKLILFENMEKQPKFKKGDTVRCIGETKITIHGEESSGWKNGKKFVVDKVNSWKSGNVYFPEEGYGVWEEHLELVLTTETRPIQISQETATRWYNGEDNELKQLAIQTFPELDEASPKVGDLCLFADITEQFNNNIGVIGTFYGYFSNSDFKFERKEGGVYKHCKKIKSIEFYD